MQFTCYSAAELVGKLHDALNTIEYSRLQRQSLELFLVRIVFPCRPWENHDLRTATMFGISGSFLTPLQHPLDTGNPYPLLSNLNIGFSERTRGPFR